MVENIKCFKLRGICCFMGYNIKIDRCDHSEVPRSSSYKDCILAGLGAVAMTCITTTSFSYFYPGQFGEWKGDIPFSVSDGYWRGYVRCEDERQKTIVVENRAGKLVSLEEALSTIPEELGGREIAKENIMEKVDKCNCSD